MPEGSESLYPSKLSVKKLREKDFSVVTAYLPFSILSFLLYSHSLSLSLSQDCATMQFCANKLDKKDFFGRSDPFMVFYRSNEDGT